MQLHFLFSLFNNVLFILISKARMATSNSFNTVEAPCIDVPPLMLTLVLGMGEDVRDAFRDVGLLFDLKSAISEPAAEGGGRGTGA